ncbi:hypothetical protein J2Z65_000670 [Paenibacillus aceris]|uniref:Uncharacterized protein n=1 Tax=Paenibacillus aceris TaxID=869555 RepID=A0ABS4HT99_9BACL|nr:hypothetical protein [Paenibacillus aceris]
MCSSEHRCLLNSKRPSDHQQVISLTVFLVMVGIMNRASTLMMNLDDIALFVEIDLQLAELERS